MLSGGIDLGGTKIQAVVVAEQHVVLGQARAATPTTGAPSDVAAAIVAALREAAGQAGLEPSQLTHVGVGSRAPSTPRRARSTSAKNLPGWAGSYPLAKQLRTALGRPVALGNDVQVATDAEAALGAGRGYGSMLGVFWGTGVGGGIVLDGAALAGPRRGRRDRPRRREGRRGALPLRAARLHGGVRGAQRARGTRPRAA